jgi:hypothetical protein
VIREVTSALAQASELPAEYGMIRRWSRYLLLLRTLTASLRE